MITRCRIVASLVLVLLAVQSVAQPGSAPAAGGESSLAQSIGEVLDRHIDAVPGISVAVVGPQDKVWAVVRGLARKDPAEPMRTDSRMFSGSIGKSYCSAVLLQLVSEGVIDLESPLSLYLGDEPWFARLPNAESLTVRQVARHESGIPEHVWMPEFAATLREQPLKHWEPEELIAFVLDAEPLFAAGEGWSYADTNYIVLGMVIEQVTGRRYEDELRDRVLEPLGLTRTTPSSSPELPGLVGGYTSLGDMFGLPEEVATDGVYAMNPQFEWTGGGIVSTTSDLAKFMHELCAGGLVPDTAHQEMLDAAPAGARLWPGSSYGIGLIQRPSPSGELWGHAGIFPGYLSGAWHMPGSGWTFAVQINADGPDAGRALERLTAELASLIAERAVEVDQSAG
jgi:D-alanyl-D-alanine carboxypeptidase